MKRLFPILLMLALLLSGCGIIAEKAEETPASNLEPEFVFTRENFPVTKGGAALEPLAEAVASVLLGEPRERAAELLGFGNTMQSYRDLMKGDCDIVLASEPSDAIQAEMNAGSPCEIANIATDALVFYVSASNPVSSLTTEQIIKIYTGEYTNWSEVGGDDAEITAFTHDDWSGSQTAMERLIMSGEEFGTAAAANSEQTFDGSAGSIGYSFYYYANIMQMAEGCKLISVDGISPDSDTIASGEYPLIIKYCAAISASAAEGSPERILWGWLQGSEGQELIASQGYIPVR